MRPLMFLFAALCLSLQVSAQNFTGTWTTIDDATGEAKSHVQIFEGSGKYYGKVIKLLRPNAKQTCDKCPDERKGKPILDMIIMVNMVVKDGMLQNGDILDPEKGSWYHCKMWLKEGDPNTMVVRGYVGPFYRTQYWHRNP